VAYWKIIGGRMGKEAEKRQWQHKSQTQQGKFPSLGVDSH
jgi:hypothetical protein